MPVLLSLLGIVAGVVVGALLAGGSKFVPLFEGAATGDAVRNLVTALAQQRIPFQFEILEASGAGMGEIRVAVEDAHLAHAQEVMKALGFRAEGGGGILQKPRGGEF